jgi:DNA-binding response OmpR family regulator
MKIKNSFRPRPITNMLLALSTATLLAAAAGRALTRDSILDAVWGQDVMVTDRSVDRCVTTLRAKIEEDPRNPALIQTIRDIGYRFEEPA